MLFTIPGNEVLANSLIKMLHVEPGEAMIRRFTDGETAVKVMSNVYEKEAIQQAWTPWSLGRPSH